MQRWEYLFVGLDVVSQSVGSSPNAMGAYLNILGGEGWELVTIIERGEHDHLFFFKRPKVSEAPLDLP